MDFLVDFVVIHPTIKTHIQGILNGLTGLDSLNFIFNLAPTVINILQRMLSYIKFGVLRKSTDDFAVAFEAVFNLGKGLFFLWMKMRQIPTMHN